MNFRLLSAVGISLLTVISGDALLLGQAVEQQSQTSQAQDQTKTQTEQTKKEKKVWTNDNLSTAKGEVSVVGANKPSAPAKAASKADSAYIQTLRKQLAKLNADLSDADTQIAALKRFSEGESNGQADRQLHKGYNMQPIDQQIHTLETKRKDTQSKIDQLLDEARKKGVQPGDLR